MTKERGFIAAIAATLLPVGVLGVAAPSAAIAAEITCDIGQP